MGSEANRAATVWSALVWQLRKAWTAAAAVAPQRAARHAAPTVIVCVPVRLNAVARAQRQASKPAKRPQGLRAGWHRGSPMPPAPRLESATSRVAKRPRMLEPNLDPFADLAPVSCGGQLQLQPHCTA